MSLPVFKPAGLTPLCKALDFSAALRREKDAWTKKIDEASDAAFGLNLLEESVRESVTTQSSLMDPPKPVIEGTLMCSIQNVKLDMKIDNATLEGYLTIRTNDLGFTKEMYDYQRLGILLPSFLLIPIDFLFLSRGYSSFGCCVFVSLTLSVSDTKLLVRY